jgi:hypothetical protein
MLLVVPLDWLVVQQSLLKVLQDLPLVVPFDVAFLLA